LELAFVLMTRSGRVDYEDLKKRDPGFIAAYEEQTAGAGDRING
ncbi:MAG TPA: monooxygenase, partial [Blastocatellia bacterium]|nr:monooxygenase [Blastocatellia bacterium]